MATTPLVYVICSTILLVIVFTLQVCYRSRCREIHVGPLHIIRATDIEHQEFESHGPPEPKLSI